MAQARTNPWLVLVVLTSGFFMILLDTTIVNVAIPAMSAGLNTTLDQILWVLNAYILVYAVLLITAGRLGDLYGQRNLFAIGLFIFTVASALCGLSQNAGELIHSFSARAARRRIWSLGWSGGTRDNRRTHRRGRHRHLHQLAVDLLRQRPHRNRGADRNLRDHP
ncbi:MAG: MFS transporter [Chloroflexi bacterium]|nr:MAG: MFS transporter [Chloroflexota bacterium]